MSFTPAAATGGFVDGESLHFQSIDRLPLLHGRILRRDWVCRFVAARRQVLQVNGDRAQIGVGQMRGGVHDRVRHRSGGGIIAVAPGFEVEGNVVDRPIPNAEAAAARQVRRVPVLQHGSLHCLAVLVAAHRVLRRVAQPAMLRGLDQIGAAVPFRRFAGIGFEFTRCEI